MAKKTETSLAVAEEPQGGALATYSRSFEIEGMEQGDIELSRIIIHQGDNSTPYYGDHPKGALVVSDTQQAITKPLTFVCLSGGKMRYRKFLKPFGSGMAYEVYNKSEVPAADLEWSDGPQGKRVPPEAEQLYDCIVLVDGFDVPMMLTIKLNSKKRKAALKTLYTMEKMQASSGKPPLQWKYDTQDDPVNGKARWSPKFTPAGHATADQISAIQGWLGQIDLSKVKVRDEHDASVSEAYDPDADA